MLERGADLIARDNDGFDALVAAATGGTAEVCRLLLSWLGWGGRVRVRVRVTVRVRVSSPSEG